MEEYFVSCDWGTSHCGLQVVRRDDGVVIDTVSSDKGAAALAGDQDGYGDELTRLLGELDSRGKDAPIVISGMASSSIGWKELPYAEVPFSLSGESLVVEELDFPGRLVLLISGVATGDDVMRGEEVELVGLHQLGHLQGDCIAITPGTHSKHVQISDGKVTNFETFMTGELFELMSQHSILKHSVELGSDLDIDSFLRGVERGVKSPLSNAFFKVRTGSLLSGLSLSESASYLDGIVIGGELSSLIDRRESIVLYSVGVFFERYKRAAAHLGIDIFANISREEGKKVAAFGQRKILEVYGA